MTKLKDIWFLTPENLKAFGKGEKKAKAIYHTQSQTILNWERSEIVIRMEKSEEGKVFECQGCGFKLYYRDLDVKMKKKWKSIIINTPFQSTSCDARESRTESPINCFYCLHPPIYHREVKAREVKTSKHVAAAVGWINVIDWFSHSSKNLLTSLNRLFFSLQKENGHKRIFFYKFHNVNKKSETFFFDFSSI